MMNDPIIPTDRVIDAAIAERVMGFKRIADVNGLPVFESHSGGWLLTDGLVQAGSFAMQYDPPSTLPRYSTDIDAAWRVVAFMRERLFSARRFFVEALRDEVGKRLNFTSKIDHSEVVLNMLPVDICKAALAWVDGRKQREEDAR